MTPAEAIEKQIEREEQELKDLKAEADALAKKMIGEVDAEKKTRLDGRVDRPASAHD